MDKTIQFDISFPDSTNYILVTVKGPINRERGKSIARHVNKALAENHRQNQLFDLRDCKNDDKVANNFYFANEDSKEIELVTDSLVAYLVANSDYSHDFVATAMRNSGFNVKVFRNEQEAINWLSLP